MPAAAQILLSFLMLSTSALAAVQVLPAAGTAVLDGESPHLRVTGLRPGEVATVHTFRMTSAYASNTYAEAPVLAHAQAVFTADEKGEIAVDAAIPLRGTYRGADALGLLWSGTRLALSGEPAEAITLGLDIGEEHRVVVRVEAPSLGTGHWVQTDFRLTDGADSVVVREVALPGLNGAYARAKATPAGQALPAILILHGSEGGSTAAARASAIRFAHLGYAAFAVNYFAWPDAGLDGIPQALVDVPVEELQAARTWLMAQPGVDARQVALWGVSKGAELALVAAAHYDWVDRVTACVPSDVVWEGFGRGLAAGEINSSWSIGGKGLAYVPYDNFKDANDRKFSWAYVHTRSLTKASAEQRAAARIPIEQAHAKILLLASDNDVVWPSGVMAGQIETSLRGLKTEARVQSLVFQNASHYICGTGSEPRRINLVHKPEGNDPTPEADAHAAAAGWQATQEFLRR